jgi:hypothetical protein
MKTKVVEIGRKVYVIIYEPEKIEKVVDEPRKPKWNADMSYKQEHDLLYQAVPEDEWVTSRYIKNVTGVPFSRVKITSRLKNTRGIEYDNTKSKYSGVLFRRRGLP